MRNDDVSSIVHRISFSNGVVSCPLPRKQFENARIGQGGVNERWQVRDPILGEYADLITTLPLIADSRNPSPGSAENSFGTDCTGTYPTAIGMVLMRGVQTPRCARRSSRSTTRVPAAQAAIDAERRLASRARSKK